MVPAALAQLHPIPAAYLDEAQRQARVDTLPHCRASIEAALTSGVPAHARELTALERAQCAFAEQLAFSVSSLDDHHVGPLLEHLSEAEVWAFVVAVYEIDVDVRLSLVTQAVL
jgi:alkylhydroperoxidase family enzyme